jgi:hypothetical protein
MVHVIGKWENFFEAIKVHQSKKILQNKIKSTYKAFKFLYFKNQTLLLVFRLKYFQLDFTKYMESCRTRLGVRLKFWCSFSQ